MLKILTKFYSSVALIFLFILFLFFLIRNKEFNASPYLFVYELQSMDISQGVAVSVTSADWLDTYRIRVGISFKYFQSFLDMARSATDTTKIHHQYGKDMAWYFSIYEEVK